VVDGGVVVVVTVGVVVVAGGILVVGVVGCVVVVVPGGVVAVAVVITVGVIVVAGVVFSTPPQAVESRINKTTRDKAITNLVFISPSLAWLIIFSFFIIAQCQIGQGGVRYPLSYLSHLPNATDLSE
jgi:hypothetical protein